MVTIVERLKYRYKNGDVLVKFLFINITVFFILKVIAIFFLLFNLNRVDLISFLGVPSGLSQLLNRFWTPFTYMFVHEQLWHLLFNMLWLYWFGRIFLQYFTGRTLGSLYVLGGLGGAMLYVVAFNTVPYFIVMGDSLMIGASAAVMAVVMGAAFYRPNVRLNLLFIGQVRIVYIAIAVFLIDLFSLGSGVNEGGHVAHIGGAMAGYIFALQYRKGRDITGWVSSLIDGLVNLTKPRKRVKMKVEYRKRETDLDYNERRNSQQAEIDAILDKLKKSGYSNLTPEEKKKLFDASKK
ncbi:rhomboid family intramembrane serine protease [Petrimonas mucosa]|jgi:membrane associated rhomboid family serine protease|uniref:rhomboid family intramembrane serine protease n=1 Tax=Petrimonas mucosa TaxID=1642646 RepID=UPI003BD88674